jgi:hypothetical protein
VKTSDQLAAVALFKFAYETDQDIPLPILGGMDALRHPLQAAGRMANAGGEGAGGGFRTALMQILGGGAGGGIGHLAGGKNRVASLIMSILGVGAGQAAGAGIAGNMHNTQSREQFGKALSGSLSANDRATLPSGLMKLIDEGRSDKVLQLLPKNAPDIAARPYVKNLMDSQKPV